MDIHEAPREISRHSESKTTITIKKDHFFIGLAIVMLIVGFSGGYLLHDITGAGGGTPNPTINNPTQNPTPTANQTAKVFVSTGTSPVLGDKNAPLTIIEFSDYQCPYCGKFATGTEAQIITDYVKTGKVKIVFKNFPLSFHPNAMPAAVAAECAEEQGKFWEFHDKLFSNQQNLSTDSYNAWAKELNLDTAKFATCLNSTTYQAEIQKDQSDGTAAGVTGTPTMLVGNDKTGYTKIVGAQPYDIFKQAIDAALGK